MYCKSTLFVFLLTLVIISVVPLHSQTPVRTSKIKNIVGTANIRRSGTVNWVPARVNMPVKERDAVRTFIESELELETSEGTILKLGENATLELDKLTSRKNVDNTKVKILNGTIVANVKKLVNSSSKFEFETPTATAAIRGTVVGFDVGKEKTTIKVFQGTVLVTPNGTRRGVEIKDNQMTSVVKGQKEIKIEKLELKPGESQPKIESGMSDSAKSEGAMNTSDTTAVNDTVAQGIMQASKADSANSKPHLPEIAVGNGDEDELETSEQNETVTSTASTSAKKEATLSKVLNFNVKFPSDGQVFSKTTIPVNGTVSPGATVTAASIRIPVTASGTFSGQVPIPNEDGEIDIEFEASLDGNTRNITRKIIYQPEYRFNLTAPKENQIVNSTSIQIKGEVLPAGAKVSVLGRSMNVLPNGIFSGTVQIPDEPGKVELDVEITFGLTTKNETRNIVYQKPADISRPEIQTVLPQISESNQISLAVYDRTADDEITLNYTVDGVNESEKGLPNSSFIVPLQAGTHTYTFQAVDKTGNSSQVVSQNIIWFGATDWMIKTNKTIDVLYLPPSGPGNDYEPVYTLEFSIENLPDNDMRLISLVTVVNKTTGESQTRKTFTDHYFTIDMKLKNHTTNMFDISIEDVRKKIKTRNVQVVIK